MARICLHHERIAEQDPVGRKRRQRCGAADPPRVLLQARAAWRRQRVELTILQMSGSKEQVSRVRQRVSFAMRQAAGLLLLLLLRGHDENGSAQEASSSKRAGRSPPPVNAIVC